MLKIRSLALKLNWFLSSQLGLDFQRTILSLKGFPAYVYDLIVFRKYYKGVLNIQPCLGDRYSEAGEITSEYFWQDLIVSKRIFAKQPIKHVDVGSRFDGFISHVASFRDLEVFDIRDLSFKIPGVTFRQNDLTCPKLKLENYCDSISCLHALEHFGLGRYGDTLDINGYKKGFETIARLLKKDGKMYLSVPIGIERVEFNANRVFSPYTILGLSRENSLKFDSLTVINSKGVVAEYAESTIHFKDLEQSIYNLGLFEFSKK